MAASLTQTLIGKDFRNWLKGALAVLFAREGLIDFVENEITDHQNDLLNAICNANGIPAGTTCSSCTTANVLVCPTQGFCSKGKKCKLHNTRISNMKPNKACPLCTALRDAIRNEHRYGGPSWKNTDTRRWCTDVYEIAKCYMPPDGYCDKSSLGETDFNGVLAVIINNKRFEKKLSINFSNQSNICEEARKAAREIRHSPGHLLSDKDLVSYIDVFKQLLSDPVYLAADDKAKEAVEKLRQLKTNTLTIHANDITSVLNDNIKATFDDQQHKIMHEILEHFKIYKADSVETIDRKIEEFDELKVKSIVEIKEHIEKGKREFNAHIERGNDELDDKIEDGINELGEIKAKFRKSVNKLNDKVIKSTDELVSQIELGKHEFEEGKKEIEAYSKQMLKEINRSAELNYWKNDDMLLQDIKDDLITYYQTNESMISAACLDDEHTVLLDDLYVIPPLWAYDDPYNFKFGTNTQTGDQTPGNYVQNRQKTTISQLFVSGNLRCKKIYITANAGCGKTSLTQKLTIAWCQTHSLVDNYECEESIAMQNFDLLFLLHLRDYQYEQICNLDDMILIMVSNKLSRSTQYTKEVLQRLLHNKQCLIILDGLDEWTHPDKCSETRATPHNNHPNSCTVITTSRLWKLGTIGLSPNHIDRHIEISELNYEARLQLETKAIRILNEKHLNLTEKDRSDFAEEMRYAEIGDILSNPYILLQVLCLFFCGIPLGKSKSEIYSNIIEFTLQRGLRKRHLPDILVQSYNTSVPSCMKLNEACNRYIDLIMKLGKLAFLTLFSEQQESSLLFDRKIVTQYLTEQEIEFCLKVGLLCQTKDTGIIAVRRYNIYFQHKSIQEFFSAIYITSERMTDTTKSTIQKVCLSFSSILEMSNIFIFVCSINPEIYACISGELQSVVGSASVAYRYRTDIAYENYLYDSTTILSYQSMQLQCFQESKRNGNENCTIHLQDVVLDDENQTLDDLKTIIHFNKGNVKSLQLSLRDEKIAAFIKSLDPDVFTYLETLRERFYKEPEWLADILTKSAHSFKCLTLSGRHSFISNITITAVTGLTSLQSLYIGYVTMNHNNVEQFYSYIGQTTTLTQLKLTFIDCSDHKAQYHDCVVVLVLHRLNELKMLHFDNIPCKRLRINPACLDKLTFTPRGINASDSESFWEDLRGAPVLSSLEICNITRCQEMMHTVPSLAQLKHIRIESINIGDNILLFSPLMSKLERVELCKVTMSSSAWTELFLSSGELPNSIDFKLSEITMKALEWRKLFLTIAGLAQSITVDLRWCNGPTKKGWKVIVCEIKSSRTLSILQDLKFGYMGASLTLRKT